MSFENEEGNPFQGSNVYDDEGKEEITDDISIQLRNEKHDNLYYEINTGDKIQTLVEKYKTDIGVSQGVNIYLSFKGKMMDNNKTFAEYGVESNDILDIIQRLKGGYL